MITVRRLKLAIAAAASAVLIVSVLLVMRQAGATVLRATSGADPMSVFHDTPAAPVELAAVLHWQVDPPRDGRIMEPRTRTDITAAYAQALSALDRAARGDASAPVTDTLVGPLLDRTRDDLRRPSATPVSVHEVSQSLVLRFYSDDGSIVAFDVPSAEVVRIVGAGTGAAVLQTDEHLRVVMLLVDGDWRVQQLQRQSIATPAVESREPVALSRPLFGANTVTENAQDPTWSTFDAGRAADDLDAAVQLGMNTVRVFISGPEFGAVHLDHVRAFLDLAADRGVSVVPVLFDGSANHEIATWAASDAAVDEVVGALAGHPAIALWDIKNEPDRDDVRSGGASLVDAWLRRISARVRAIDPTTPVTIGWSNATAATRVLDAVDVVSFHHFGSASSLSSGITSLRGTIGGRQLVMSEFGRPAWRGFVQGDAPHAQASEVAALDRTARDAGLAGRLVWLLRDPTSAPAAGGGAWADRTERSYGLLGQDGTRHPVASALVGDPIGDAAVGESVRALVSRIRWLLALGTLVAALATARRDRGRRRRRRNDVTRDELIEA